ncbi:DUF4928 family protein [Nonomuraea salmonea]|uniref:DUF4928 family protein n=1 Tax=Nonomuraea salmonea TaxID=46181 RepID=UPI0031E755AB
MVKLDVGDVPPHVEAVAVAMLATIAPWYESQRKRGVVDSNVMCAGMYITEFLATAFPLTPAVYAAESQVKGASGAKSEKACSLNTVRRGNSHARAEGRLALLFGMPIS